MTTVARQAVSPDRALRRLFLLLFLRGRSARGMDTHRGKGAPTSIRKRLGIMLGFYALFGMMAMSLVRQPVFLVSTYLHAMTMVFLGLTVATSAGEILFNKEEADILLHRPIEPSVMLRTRIVVLVQVTLWLAGAFNFAGFFVGLASPDGNWWYPVVHAVTVTVAAVFVTGLIVVVYQLCLRWFGREKLDAFMTATQVLVAIAVVLGGQLVPQLMIRVEGTTIVTVDRWWVVLLPPAWFAGMDDALAGSGAARSWLLALLAMGSTVVLAWMALVRLAGDYQGGLQTISEASTRKAVRTPRRIVERLVNAPPLRWWLREPVARASFLLVAAYLVRDRDVKLRVYPGVAPMLILPVLGILPSASRSASEWDAGAGMGSSYLAIVPMLVMGMLTYSQNWQASDVFRVAPMLGPAALSHGLRRAVLALIAVPTLLLYGLLLVLLGHGADLVMLVPPLIVMPVLALSVCLGGKAVPFSRPTDAAQAVKRTLGLFFGALIAAMGIGFVATIARHGGWLHWMLLGELVLCGGLYALMRSAVATVKWRSLE